MYGGWGGQSFQTSAQTRGYTGMGYNPMTPGWPGDIRMQFPPPMWRNFIPQQGYTPRAFYPR